MIDKNELNQLYRYACSLTKDADNSYDLLQASIEKMLGKDYQKIENKTAYLMRSIRNRYIDQKRRENKFPLDSIEDEAQIFEVDEQIGLEELVIESEKVAELITYLSPMESELLYLWAVEEYTIDEIARLQNIPRGTLLSRLSRMKKRVKQQFVSTNEQLATVK